MFDEIINEKDKEIQRKLLFKYIDSTNFDTFLYYLNNNNSSLYPFFEMIKDNLIDVYVNKEPLIFDISDDDIINITGDNGTSAVAEALICHDSELAIYINLSDNTKLIS